MDKLIKVEVKKDHLDKVARASALNAITELVWNAFDADADSVRVFIERNDFGLQSIQIEDDGHGIDNNKSYEYFSSLGGSWKEGRGVSPKGRFLHGKEGQGRFKAFSVGRVIDWSTTFYNDSKYWSYSISGISDSKNIFNTTSVVESKTNKTGTVVSISELHKEFTSLNTDRVLEHFSSMFAIFLSHYKTVQVYVDGLKVDPESQIENKTTINLEPVFFDGHEYNYELQIIEWNCEAKNEIQLCNEKGFPLLTCEKKPRGINGFSYTAYLKSDHISKLSSMGRLGLGDLETSLTKPIESAIALIKNHFILRKIENSSDKIKKWKNEDVYPYKDIPQNHVEQAEMQIFDILALNISEQIPEFDRTELKLKKFQFSLLKQIVNSKPNDLHKILTEVLNLSEGKQSELAELLDEVSLSAIISTAKVISDRLKFISGLEDIIFHPDKKKALKERSQLHKILSENTWIFGDEFSLTVNDKSLSEVLRIHLEKQGINLHLDKPVTRIDGSVGIVDLMLTRSIAKNHVDEREHLIVELKAPAVKIGSKEITQIESYAFAVAEDERFKHLKTKWNFWVISNDLSPYAVKRLEDGNKSKGVIYNSNNTTIWVKTWGEIIQECKHRLEFIKNQLNINIDTSDGLDFLQLKYSEYTKGVIFSDDIEEVDA